jgi:hypothetical protein
LELKLTQQGNELLQMQTELDARLAQCSMLQQRDEALSAELAAVRAKLAQQHARMACSTLLESDPQAAADKMVLQVELQKMREQLVRVSASMSGTALTSATAAAGVRSIALGSQQRTGGATSVRQRQARSLMSATAAAAAAGAFNRQRGTGESYKPQLPATAGTNRMAELEAGDHGFIPLPPLPACDAPQTPSDAPRAAQPSFRMLTASGMWAKLTTGAGTTRGSFERR